jgi:hypothetical protein
MLITCFFAGSETKKTATKIIGMECLPQNMRHFTTFPGHSHPYQVLYKLLLLSCLEKEK